MSENTTNAYFKRIVVVLCLHYNVREQSFATVLYSVPRGFLSSVKKISKPNNCQLSLSLIFFQKNFKKDFHTKNCIFHETMRFKRAGATASEVGIFKGIAYLGFFFFSLESTGDWRRNVENFKGEAALRQFYGSATGMVLCTSRPRFRLYFEISRVISNEFKVRE